MCHRPCGMLDTDFLISLFLGRQWSESHHEYKRIGLSLLQQVVIVQKPAGAGGSGIKQKQSCLNLHLLLLFDKKWTCAQNPDHQWSVCHLTSEPLNKQTCTHTHTCTNTSYSCRHTSEHTLSESVSTAGRKTLTDCVILLCFLWRREASLLQTALTLYKNTSHSWFLTQEKYAYYY